GVVGNGAVHRRQGAAVGHVDAAAAAGARVVRDGRVNQREVALVVFDAAATVVRDDHVAERQRIGIPDAAALGGAAAADGQAADGDRVGDAARDGEDAALAARVDGEDIGTRALDRDTARDGQRPAGQGDSALQAGGEDDGKADAGQLRDVQGLA